MPTRPDHETDRMPPVNLRAEECVLGSILLKPEVIDDVANILQAGDFHDPAHRTLYEQILAMMEAGSRIDAELIIDRLKRKKLFEAIGGPGFVESLFETVPHAAHARFYAEIVSRDATKRKLLDAASETLREVYSSDIDTDELLSRAERRIFTLAERHVGGDTRAITDVVTATMARLATRFDGGGGVDEGLATGLKDLDSICGGLRTDELIIVAGRPGVGKSAMVGNIASHVAQTDVGVLIFSLEMSDSAMLERMLSSISGVDSWRMRRSLVTSDQRSDLAEAGNIISSWPMWFESEPGQTLLQISSTARRLMRRVKIGLICVDYLQYVRPANPKAPRYEQVGQISRGLKLLARRQQLQPACASGVRVPIESRGRKGQCDATA